MYYNYKKKLNPPLKSILVKLKVLFRRKQNDTLRVINWVAVS
jgi:hypothetical protein